MPAQRFRKWVFGIVCGSGAGYKPGSSWPANLGNRDQVTVASLQGGGALGINTKYEEGTGGHHFTAYPHIVGGKGTGGVWRERANRFSHLWAIDGYNYDDRVQSRAPGSFSADEWFTIELYAKMDTTLSPPNGEFELWIERKGIMVKEAWAYDLDLGGTVADRPGLGLVRRNDDSAAEANSSAPVGPLWSGSGGGWGLHGVFARDMLGGSHSAANTPVDHSAYYVADWAVYGKA